MSVAAKFWKNLMRDCRNLKAHPPRLKSPDPQKAAWPLHILVHPFAGLSDVKYEGKGSVGVAVVVLLLYFATNVIRFFQTGFVFNANRTEEFNLVMELLSSVILVLLWAVSNWACSTLMDGEGRFREIFIVSCYALVPLIISNLLMTLFSNFFTYSEQVFLQVFQVIGILWMALLLVLGTLIVHQYTLGKTILCCLVTVFGIAAILFMAILFISIFQQMTGFIDTVSVEILNRRS